MNQPQQPEWIPLKDVVGVVKESFDGQWTFTRNNQCKYINVRIDMRDGKCVLMNRFGDLISLKDLQYQYDPLRDSDSNSG